MNNGEGLQKAIIEIGGKLEGKPDYSDIEPSMDNLRRSADYVTTRLAQVPMLEDLLAQRGEELKELRERVRTLEETLKKHGIETQNDRPTSLCRLRRMLNAVLPAIAKTRESP